MMRRMLVALLVVTFAPLTVRADVDPPQGFDVLFNGENLDGWHGRPHFDPRKLAAMKPEWRPMSLTSPTPPATEAASL